MAEMTQARVGMRSMMPHVVGYDFVTEHAKVWMPTIVDLNWFGKRVKTLTRLADVEPGSAAPHRLRHSAATNLYRSGLGFHEIANLMNHASTEMTRRYADVSAEYKREHYRNLRKRGEVTGD